MRYSILPVAAFIAAFLVLVPAFWHWRARNVPTLSLIVWLFTLNVICGVNSLVWSDNVLDKAPVWCDICEQTVPKANVFA
jgi:pheromone a factor receptor